MSAISLVDAEARRLIAEELEETLFVEAGAGSGKTTALVGRIAALVEKGSSPITGIAAITFTEAAAAELRIRVREELERRAGLATGEASANLEAALARIDEAPLSTIHGFCRRILAAHPIEAGLPPRFEVLDEVAESIEWRHRFASELDVLAATDGASELISLCWLLDVTDRRIEALARELDREWHRWDPPPEDLRAAFRALEQKAHAGLETFVKATAQAVAERNRCRDEEDGLALRIDELADLAERIAVSDWPLGLEAALIVELKGSVSKRGRQENWSGDISGVRRLVETAQDAHSSLRQGILDDLLAALAVHFQHRARLAAEDRRHRGVLTYHDLLVFCQQLLAGDPYVRKAVQRRFRYVLIDEFQDTDGLQLDIARRIGLGESGWEKGRCFFVGDPKQSIYRFRGADLAAYEAARGEIVGPGATLLTSNFRSVPGILSFVNESFKGLLGERFHALDSVRLGSGERPPVALVGGAFDGKPKRAEQRRLESEDCCRAIELAVHEERWEVEADGMSRPVCLGDIAILVPRRTGLLELEAALDAHGIAYRVESASLILRSQEVRDVLHLARAIAEPGNELALVATLRSPCYSIGDDELVAWATAGGRWSTEEEPAEAAAEAVPAVAAALADIARLRGRLGELGPAGTLSLAVRERRLFQLAAAGPRARESWRRVRYLLERARLFVEAGGSGLSDLADWIDEQLQGGARASESVVPEDDDDVVRIMTVHGAKGLEFPVTILCGFGTSDDVGPFDLVLRQDDGRPEIHFNNELETSRYKELREREVALGDEEALRLCYVAATRAKDHLVICAHHCVGSTPTLGERLHEAARPLASLWRRLPSVLEGETPDVVRQEDGRAPPAEGGLSVATIEQYEEWNERRTLLLKAATRQANVRATEVATLAGATAGPEEAGDGPDTVAEESVLPAERRRGRAGTRIGRAVHATLQSISLDDAASIAGTGADRPGAGERLEAVARAQARAERLEERGEEVARLAAAALSSPVVVSALRSGSARRELYVAAEISGTVLDGYVDLCFGEEDGSITVVDYKTDSVRDSAAVAARVAHYELQAASYALCLEEASGRPVSRCVLVFLAPPARPLEHELAGVALEEHKAAVRRLVGEIR